ncbi:MAG: SprT family zinc-dependent metalloprotease [Bacteroidota bacterium]|nr:SprT family zinc-dependent metalloprotease [Bacteroidota bacterium]
MKQEFVEHINGIGNVQFVKTPRAKRINLRLRPGEIARVSFPPFTNINKVKAFVVERKQWILDNREKMDAVSKSYQFDPTKEFKTHYHTFHFLAHQQKVFNAKIENREVSVLYPSSIAIDNPHLQATFKSIIVKILRKEAQYYIPGRLATLADKHGFDYKQLRIKNIKSRWGSCSGKNNINLSIHIMTLPFHLIDYILLHELCHTVHKNHGKDFYHLLDTVSGNAKGLDKEVRKYRISWA